MRFPKTDIVLAGVGGQGVLSLGAIIASSAQQEGLSVMLSEVHGMAQRGGAVQASLRVSDRPIHSPLIRKGTADAVLSTEPLESLRYLDYLSPAGTLVTSTAPTANIPEYPDIKDILRHLRSLPRVLLVETRTLTRRARASKSINLVLIGAAACLLPVKPETIESRICEAFSREGKKTVDANLRAFRAGRDAVQCNPP